MLVLDYSAGKPGAAAIKRAGYGGAVRYIGFPSRTKCTDTAELRDFTAHGLGMALVYEDNADDWRGGLARGRDAGARARDHANRIGFPADRPIYMAVDRDVVTGVEFSVMVAYLRGASETLGVELTGVYGEFDVCVRAQQAGVASWFWQCRAWSGTPPRLFAGRHLYQRVGIVQVGGIGCDINDVLQPDWGQHTMEDDVSATDLFNYKIKRQGSALGGETTLGAVVANMDRAWEMQAGRDAALAAAITADKDITPAELGALINQAVAKHTPSADAIAAAQRPFLGDVVGDAVRAALGEDNADQADAIVDELVARLAADGS